MEDTPNLMKSLNSSLLDELSIEELEKRTELEILEERLEMDCWIACGTVCLCVSN